MKIYRVNWNVLTNAVHTVIEHTLVRRDFALFEFQAVNTLVFEADANGYAPVGTAVDLSEWSTDAVWAIKTESNWLAGGNFAAAFAGYYANTWHSLANGRGTIAFAVPASVALVAHRMAATLYNAAGARIQVGDVPISVNVKESMVTGSESNLPAGVPTTLSGTCTILEGNRSVDVSIPGLTVATGRAVVSLMNSGTFTQITYSKPSNGTLRVHSTAPAPVGGWTASYLVTSL